MLYLTLWGCKFVGNENHELWSPTNNDDFTDDLMLTNVTYSQFSTEHQICCYIM